MHGRPRVEWRIHSPTPPCEGYHALVPEMVQNPSVAARSPVHATGTAAEQCALQLQSTRSPWKVLSRNWFRRCPRPEDRSFKHLIQAVLAHYQDSLDDRFEQIWLWVVYLYANAAGILGGVERDDRT